MSGLASGDPVASALEKLTQIASHLTIDKKKSKTLEALLDGVGLGDAASSSASSGSRRHAAALRALRNALTRQPEEIAKAIEKNMEEDFFKVSQMPGSSSVNVTARAWLELRSRVQGYQTPVRFLWSVAGVLDSLRANKVQEARARCGLILAMGDQMSIDRGSWIVAGEVSLEDPPPLAAFNNHTLPTEAEAPYTKLIDARWLELFLSKLNDVDLMNEKKKKLNSKRNIPPVTEVDPKAAPKKQGKGSKSEKGGGKGSGGDKPPTADGSWVLLHRLRQSRSPWVVLLAVLLLWLALSQIFQQAANNNRRLPQSRYQTCWVFSFDRSSRAPLESFSKVGHAQSILFAPQKFLPLQFFETSSRGEGASHLKASVAYSHSLQHVAWWWATGEEFQASYQHDGDHSQLAAPWPATVIA